MRHSQLTDDLQEQASLYAAGAMPEGERAEYARHLDEDQCSVCRAEVDELQAAMGMLAFSAPPAEPSASVRVRLMEQARAPASARRPQSFVRRRWLELIASTAAVALLIVVMAATRANNELRRLAEVLISRINQLEIQVSQQQTYLATLTSPAVRVVNLTGQGTNAGASGRIFWTEDAPQKKWLLYVRNLPPVPQDKVYELWFVPKSGNPVGVATFNTEGDGYYEVEIDLPAGVTGLKAAAVTTEPFPGVDQPTGSFALLGAGE